MRLRLPVIGNVYLSFALSRFTRILGTLLRNGIPILQSLKIAKDSTGNRVLSNAIAEAAEHVTAGNKLAEPLATCKYLPRDIVEMISVGEESNQLEKVLLDTANALDKRTARQLELMIRLHGAGDVAGDGGDYPDRGAGAAAAGVQDGAGGALKIMVP